MFQVYRTRCLLMAVFLAAFTHLSAQAPNTGEDIRGPKPMVEIPAPKKPPYALWSGIGGGVLLLALAAILWRRHTRKQRLYTAPEIALASLAALEAMPETMAAEAFANRAAQTVRQYIAKRFGSAAPRRTTEEFLKELANEKDTLLVAESDHLRTFLKSCDLAKYAGLHLDPARRGELINAARGFIHSTSIPTTS